MNWIRLSGLACCLELRFIMPPPSPLGFEARKALIETLQKKKLYRGAKNNKMRLGLCLGTRTGNLLTYFCNPEIRTRASIVFKELLLNCWGMRSPDSYS
ncbi:hypothetical protein COLO4_00376 [Corchorus olitorius]|uniref:Uncharacterized protein n=1 Tax=Corchorus olitorius TaxID=93759 RepID=A0A1R3L174_9ROSI|nr:hypothetical protein COLO4_02406 [Corchorus olitorius]OMP14045.1 hypothetical protein COLO4_00376 [Corchorus olitorius]